MDLNAITVCDNRDLARVFFRSCTSLISVQDGAILIFEREVQSPNAQDLKAYVDEVYNKVNLELIQFTNADEDKVSDQCFGMKWFSRSRMCTMVRSQ